MKADCEGNEGPQTFNKTEADGANMLARALVTALHGGTQVVMWRAFIYGGDTSNAHEEKAKQEYDTIHPLDGKFDPNVIVQVRHTLSLQNTKLRALHAIRDSELCSVLIYLPWWDCVDGISADGSGRVEQIKHTPMDFLIRDPLHPLLAGGLTKTSMMMEAYTGGCDTGQQIHAVALTPQWRHYLAFDLDRNGTTIASVLSGKHPQYRHRLPPARLPAPAWKHQ